MLYRRLRRYADRGRPEDTNSDRLFLGLRRSPLGTYDALTTSGVNQLLRLLAGTAGIKKRVHPTSCATRSPPGHSRAA
jgi:hypothetical protein